MGKYYKIETYSFHLFKAVGGSVWILVLKISGYSTFLLLLKL